MMSTTDKQVRTGVAVFIVKDGKILIGERTGAHGENTWGLPGGHLEFGESIEQCAQREVLEETGLIIDTVEATGFTNDIFKDEEKHYITLFVTAKSFSGTPDVLEPNKCKQWQWFDLSSLPSPLFLPLSNFLKNNPEFSFYND